MKHFHCPVNDYACAYYIDEKVLVEGEEPEYCLCSLEDPYVDCDDFYAMYAMYGDCEEEDYTDETEE